MIYNLRKSELLNESNNFAINILTESKNIALLGMVLVTIAVLLNFIVFYSKEMRIIIGNIGLYYSKCLKAALNARRPKKIFVLRHGESEANIDPAIYDIKADNKIELTENGKSQAVLAAEGIINQLPANAKRVKLYVSPFKRTRQTAELIKEQLTKLGIQVLIKEDPRIREQEMGNYQDQQKLKTIWAERALVGRFYYRMPSGESGADVYDRATNFLEYFNKDIQSEENQNLDAAIIVTHGLFMRVLLTSYFDWSVEHFEGLKNPKNCETWVLEKNEEETEHGRYTLKSEIN